MAKNRWETWFIDIYTTPKVLWLLPGSKHFGKSPYGLRLRRRTFPHYQLVPKKVSIVIDISQTFHQCLGHVDLDDSVNQSCYSTQQNHVIPQKDSLLLFTKRLIKADVELSSRNTNFPF